MTSPRAGAGGRRRKPVEVPAPSEAEVHRSVAAWLRQALPGVFWTTFPAGGGGRIRGAQLRGAGLVPGIPDILLLDDGGHAYWIELKAKNGRVSPEQVATHNRLRAMGCPVAICRSIDEVERALRGWGFGLSARAA